ncbi:hypothetical protein PFICI_14246 [Pestalotiopsis fici W106-1]|uniref:Cytochrome P450 n=1 Tax=Pestalotiopsis fici (strain W106-1 / CGMCC3.15140) TaxID=1229662 RepID=W3WKC7_PESFW|nr:uncharacterized protein PFICI_14246 [Pestalotiopsis fici W106-1]ETS74380.1 hypothetical protein PFICI_14246 [Pestalotiopsis fici W106-1]
MDFATLTQYWPRQLAFLPSNYTAAVLAVFVAMAVSFSISWANAGPSIPRIASTKSWFASRRDFADHGIEIIQKGFDQVESGVFRVTSLDGSDLVILAPRHWLHLCKKKDDEIAPAREEFFRCSLHGAAFDEPYLYTYVNARMQGFDRHFHAMSQALDKAMFDVLGSDMESPTVGFKRVFIQPQVIHIFSQATWRVFLGDSFTSEVADIFQRYVAALIPLMRKLTTQRPMVARLVAAFSDEVRQVHEQLKRMTALFTPMLEQCVDAVEQGTKPDSVNNEWFEDLVRLAPAEKRRDYKFLTNIFIGFAFTFIFSPVPVTTQIIFEFAFRPDYTEFVLQETQDVLGKRHEDWAFSKENLRRLSLLDSFCKETHKHHPTAASNMKKITVKPQNLANGVTLPAGTVFEVVEIAAHLSNPAFEDPSTWNGRRYFDLRQKTSTSTSATKYDWGAATRDDLNFGYATHMCPGRSAGCSIVKMFMVKLLSHYELCMVEGETQRYEDVYFGQFISPNQIKPILIRLKKQP